MTTMTLHDFETGEPRTAKITPDTDITVQEDRSDGKTGTLVVIIEGTSRRQMRVREDRNHIHAEFTVLQDMATREN